MFISELPLHLISKLCFNLFNSFENLRCSMGQNDARSEMGEPCHWQAASYINLFYIRATEKTN